MTAAAACFMAVLIGFVNPVVAEAYIPFREEEIDEYGREDYAVWSCLNGRTGGRACGYGACPWSQAVCITIK